MGKLAVMTNVDRRYAMMKKCMVQLQEEGKLDSETLCFRVEDGSRWDQEWEKYLKDADAVFVKWMGSTLKTDFWKKCRRFLERNRIPYLIDAAGSDEPQADFMVDPDTAARIHQYTVYSGMKNYRNLYLYGASVFCGSRIPWEEPGPVCWAGLYHPGLPLLFETDLCRYEQRFCRPGRPSVGILFYRDEWIWGDLGYQTALIGEIEKQGMNAVCVFTNGMPDESLGAPPLRQVFHDFFTHDGVPAVDVILNTMKFSFMASGSVSAADMIRLGIPVLQAYTLLSPGEEWRKSMEGMNAMEVSISVSLPEFDGVIHGVPVAAKHLLPDGDVEYVPMEERICLMVRKARKWAALRRKENSAKRVAVVFHNYPPKNSNIGSAVGLDTIESIRRLLHRMKDEGYHADSLPDDTEALIRELTAHATNDRDFLTDRQIRESARLEKDAYISFFENMEDSVKKQMEKDWGQAPGTVMAGSDGSLLVPGTMNGSIFVTVQPPRGFGEDPEKIYHDPFVAPTHQYLAFYRWIRDIWKADAVIHVGTHGSLEWLPGKGAGLSRDSYPELALGDLPNLYPYHMTITGEGMQAKRRGAACLIGHLPAPMTDAGMYDDLAELEKSLDEYAHMIRNEPERAGVMEDIIRRQADKAHLDGEVVFDEKQPFRLYVSALHSYLEELKNSDVHMGLHILGQPPEGARLTESILSILRLSNGDIPSLPELWAEKYGTDMETVIRCAGDMVPGRSITYSELMTRMRGEFRSLVQFVQERGFSLDAEKAAAGLPCVAEGPVSWQKKTAGVLRYICGTLWPKLRAVDGEMDALLAGLCGRYVEPGPSGSPTAGGADLLPTGRNFYGVDPRSLPTPAAWEIGKQLGDQVIERYILEEGHYPENIGMVFWSGANMRSRGQCVAEFLYLMGLRPVWQPGSLYVKGTEVIPLEELKRPRIDVTARISGLFRDTMGSVISLMDRAVLLAAGLDEGEEDNYIRKHIREDSAGLEAAGQTEAEAWRTAAYRIFGDAPGTYGAGISALLEEKNWETVDDLARVFVRWGGHAYGGSARGVYMPDQFRQRLGVLDVTVKNEDNHETNMLSSDDYNAYHGGMIAAVRSLRGKAPRSYCGDSTDRSRPVMHSVQEEAKRVFRSEAVNPKFIRGMMEHGYKGAADMANYVAHSFQWDATSGVMDDWMYDAYAEKYAFDADVGEWMKKVNPWAVQRIAETLLEADRRGLWKADDTTRDRLKELYLSVEGELEDANDEES